MFFADDPWQGVTDEMLQESVAFIDNHVSQNPNNVNSECLRHVMLWLRKDQEINPEGSTDPQPVNRSSALRMLYILRRCIEHDFTVFASRRQVQQRPATRVLRSIRFELEGIQERMIGRIIGYQGYNIKPLQRTNKCEITLESSCGGDGQRKVFVEIKKHVDTDEPLEAIKAQVLSMVDDLNLQDYPESMVKYTAIL